MDITLAQCEKKYGSVIWKNKKLIMTQEPYLRQIDNETFYQATVEDEEETEYIFLCPCNAQLLKKDTKINFSNFKIY